MIHILQDEAILNVVEFMHDGPSPMQTLHMNPKIHVLNRGVS